MRIIVVSGLSGSGKSVALHVLEDLGYYSVDNIPVALLPQLTDYLLADEAGGDRVAIGIDARNRADDLLMLDRQVARLRNQGAQVEVLFLQAEEAMLIKRFGETRRRHPLAQSGDGLREAIATERSILTPVVNVADLIIDTTRTSVYELRDLVRERIASRDVHALSILVQSFGFKHGIPADADYVFDLRCLPNPYWQPELRQETGLDKPVIDYLDSQPLADDMHNAIIAFLRDWLPRYENFSRSYLTIAVGCTGGQHRSVYMAERIARTLRSDGRDISVRHHELVRGAVGH
ncbi:MAG: RNase adapter RapZ [Pseudomonadota bacterium]